MTALFEMHIRVGGDPRGFGEFTALRDELAKLSHPACPDVDWARVEQLCLTLFHNNGAELQTAAAFALACSQRNGLEGMAQGVRLIEALCSQWSSVWPPMAAVRLDILAWLFAHWQPVLRGLGVKRQKLPALVRLANELERLALQLSRQEQPPLVTLQALRQQVASLVQRVERNRNPDEGGPALMAIVEPAQVMPVVILPAHPVPELLPAPKHLRRRIMPGLFALIALVGGLLWWARMLDQDLPPQSDLPASVRLDSLSLFDAGSTELKSDSAKVLIDALVNIQARPGWLIMIVGHTDTSGDAERNLQLSFGRASAVRDWIQRMGDLANNCFAVQGAAGTQPIASNDTVSGRAANRRVDIHLVPQREACMPASTSPLTSTAPPPADTAPPPEASAAPG